jgi:ATP-dependent helicase/nuclease subunit B
VLERGTALHLIYERIVKETLYELDNSTQRRDRIQAIVSDVANQMSLRIPIASQVVRDREVAALERDAHLFVNSEHAAYKVNPWTTVALEFAFGDAESATFPLDDNTSVRVHGRVDRVDRLDDGTLRLVDYKTGRTFELETKRGAFDGGRKLQLAVYSPAVSRHFDAAVSVAEYHFPTQRGEGGVARAGIELLEAAPRIVRSMLDDVAAGRFVPTIDKSDCAFCNYAAICRTSTDDYNTTSSPRAEWAKAHAVDSPHFVGIVSRTRGAGAD